MAADWSGGIAAGVFRNYIRKTLAAMPQDQSAAIEIKEENDERGKKSEKTKMEKVSVDQRIMQKHKKQEDETRGNMTR